MTRLRRATTVAAPLLLVILAGAWVVGPRAGSWLVDEDPLEKADVIYVLGGSRMERPLEAADLYAAGWAPLILLSRQQMDGGELELARRGVAFATEPELQRDGLRLVGVPLNAIEILRDEQQSTSAEAATLVDLAIARHWSRIIVVTSKMHTRRAGLSLRRQLDPHGITLIARASHYDVMKPDVWWRDRDDLRFTLFEYQKLLLYRLRIAD